MSAFYLIGPKGDGTFDKTRRGYYNLPAAIEAHPTVNKARRKFGRPAYTLVAEFEGVRLVRTFPVEGLSS